MRSELEAEANRQLSVCNACRYCEGYCAVYPALERRRDLTTGDLVQLANLCHDCRACYYACMYSPPHEFGVNPPALFSEIRRASYDELAGAPGSVLRRATTRRRAFLTFVAVSAVVIVAALLTVGSAGLGGHGHGAASPYSVLSYGAILVLGLVPAVASVLAVAVGARRYRQLTGAAGRRPRLGEIAGATLDALRLRYLDGGGEGCTYPEDRPSFSRRAMHHVMAYGFLACLVATISAAIEQDIAGRQPPYRFVSVPVLTGTIGGIGLVLGTLGLAAIKTRADPAPGDPPMAARDYGLLGALFFLGLSGLAVLALRTTAGYPALLIVHLGAVFSCFAVFSATKFVHFVYRGLALLNDRGEIALERAALER
jgi:citrate/tricarballylate utilization protein